MAGYAMENNCFGRGQRAGLGMEKELGGRRKLIPRPAAQRAQKYGHEVVCGACDMKGTQSTFYCWYSALGFRISSSGGGQCSSAQHLMQTKSLFLCSCLSSTISYQRNRR